MPALLVYLPLVDVFAFMFGWCAVMLTGLLFVKINR